MTNKQKIVEILLKNALIETEDASPCLVADIAFNAGIELTSNEVIGLSNAYTFEPMEGKAIFERLRVV